MTEGATIRDRLKRRLKTRRVVIWHDPAGEYAREAESLDLPQITVLPVANDEYAIKHRILRGEPDGRFVVYRKGAVPEGTANWLLDLELAYGVFTADRAALVRDDLGLPSEVVDGVVRAHESFFRDPDLVARLKPLLHESDRADHLRAKMSAVLLGQQEHSMLELTRTLLVAHANDDPAKHRALAEHGLDAFHWAGAARIYGYESTEPSVDDFVLWMFRRALEGFASNLPGGLRNIQIDFGSLRNDLRSMDAMRRLAGRAAKRIHYAASIDDLEAADLVGTDVFEDAERKIVSDLARGVAERTITHRTVDEVVRSRRTSFWIDGYRVLYDALDASSELLDRLKGFDPKIASFGEGLDRYRHEWFRIDQLYRRFHLAVRIADNPRPLERLRGQVDKQYIHTYLHELGGEWQVQVDAVEQWKSAHLTSQHRFFATHVEPIIRGGRKKAVVIVSDALRYEVAEELRSRIRQEDRFEAKLDAMLGVLPSYTQLGMAALLPNTTLAHSDQGDPVLVDGQRSDGTANRSKILAAKGGIAIQAEDVLDMTSGRLRELYGRHQVIYVYHDRIDAAGDKATTERQVFEAVEDALRELVALVKRLASANATNILVTADHGFLYQDRALSDADYLSELPHGDAVIVKKRRYALGRGLKPSPAFRTFEPGQVSLASDLQMQIPKSIHRLSLPGAGSRFVHGGASLQEIVVPVLTINKKRSSDVHPVNVEIQQETDKITTGTLAVKLLQTERVSDKVQPRTLRAGLYAGEQLISNQPELVFDRASEDKRDRIQVARMVLSQEADAFNGSSVEFRLEERAAGTTQWHLLPQRAVYTIKRSFTTDFDF